ncbi:MAG: Maf family nucleotide pyrophosphatase [Flavobacteriales bacterium]
MIQLPFELLLASKSPRRQQLLRELGVDFKVMKIDVNEDFSNKLKREQIPLFLSELKARTAQQQLQDNQVCLTADTIVWLDDHVLNKAENALEATAMLQSISGRKHEVITACSLSSREHIQSFFAVTEVYFRQISDDEIQYYIQHFKPFDKAGAYGIQEWIGFIGVERIIGSFYNVVGLPVFELYTALRNFKP